MAHFTIQYEEVCLFVVFRSASFFFCCIYEIGYTELDIYDVGLNICYKTC